MIEILWEELVPNVIDQEDWFKAASTKSNMMALTTQAKSKKKGKKGEASSSKPNASS